MLKTFGISNFKAFSSFQSFNAAPITLIFGPNSGGKSSIIQALMLLRQSVGAPINQRLRGRYLVLKGPYVDLGQSKSIHHRHDTDTPMTFFARFDVANPGPGSVFSGRHEFGVETRFQEVPRKAGHKMPELTGVSYEATDLERGATFRCSLERMRKNSSDLAEADVESNFLKKSFQFKHWDDAVALSDFVKALPRVKAQVNSSELSDLLDGETVEAIQVSVRPNLMTGRVPFLPFFIRRRSEGVNSDRGVPAFDFGSRVLNQITRAFTETFQAASYLGPHRNRPRRVYEIDHQYQGSVGVSGEYLIESLTEDFDSQATDGESVIDEVNRWLERFEIPYSLTVDSLGNEVVGDIATLKLFDKRTEIYVAATDVGFGIGQLLPVVIEGVLAKKRVRHSRPGVMLCVEQPEIHLHPRLQAHVADFFIDTWKEGGCQWIAETHSEALMLRIQRRIRERVISASDVAVVFVNPIPGIGSEIINLRLDENGDFIDEWPGGFFEESFREMFL